MTQVNEPPPDEEEGWLGVEIDGHSVRFWLMVALLITVSVITFGAWWTYG